MSPGSLGPAFRLAVFDLDGTLADTPSGIVETFTAAFAALGLPPSDPAAIRATIGLPLARAFGDLLGLPPGPDGVQTVAACVREYQRLFPEIVLPRARELLFPGVVDGLSALRADGVLLAVATSKFQLAAEALLGAAGILDLFHLVLGADRVARPKPHPDMGLAVLAQLGVQAEAAVMVGDTTHDLLMARAAGLRSIAVTYGVHGVPELSTADPTWLVDTFADVVARVRTTSPSPDPALLTPGGP